MAEKEIWKTYPEFPFIEVSIFGEVRTKDRVVIRSDGRKLHIKGRALRQFQDNNGYMRVGFSVNGKNTHRKVHRMVAITFIPNPNNYPEVNHIDNNPTNNAVSNLEWCDRQYNNDYKRNFGTTSAELFGRPVIAIDLNTFKIFRFKTQLEASRQLGANVGSINHVINGKQNKTHGYWFCYADSNAIEKVRVKFGNDVAEKVEKLLREHL